jgi:hypothetical protein
MHFLHREILSTPGNILSPARSGSAHAGSSKEADYFS